MKIAIAADHGGFHLKSILTDFLQKLGHAVNDLGTHSEEPADYPDYARAVAHAVLDKKAERGVLICGSGVGASIAANKVNGIRCALVHDTFSAKATREHNDTNMLAMGERVIGAGLARDIAKIWLTTDYEGGRHENRVGKIKTYETK